MSKAELEKALELKKQLTAAGNDASQLRTALMRLRQEVNPTEELLKDTKLGIAVGAMRKNENKEIAELAKDIVKKWKTAVDANKSVKAETKPSPSTSTNSTPKAVSPAADRKPSKATNGVAAKSQSSLDPDQRSGETDKMNFEVLLDKTRDKCLELIYNALVFDSSAPAESVFKCAKAIEEGAYTGYGNSTNTDYKNKMRSLYLNLKDKNNPELRAAIIGGDLQADSIWSMSPQDLASKERQLNDAALKDKNIFDSLGATAAKSETDMFQCNRCKQRKCTYYQMQTRSADEPMTTFVTCTYCDNRWKFC